VTLILPYGSLSTQYDVDDENYYRPSGSMEQWRALCALAELEEIDSSDETYDVYRTV
jgi:hypothetical protein